MFPSEWKWHLPEPGAILAGIIHPSKQCLSHPHLPVNHLLVQELDHLQR